MEGMETASLSLVIALCAAHHTNNNHSNGEASTIFQKFAGHQFSHRTTWIQLRSWITSGFQDCFIVFDLGEPCQVDYL
jgi:hypothetical protein